MKNTIVITGGAGYIGSAIGLLLSHMGYHIIMLDTLIHHQNILPLTWGTLLVHNYGDPQILDTLFTAHHVLAVIHCAGYSNVEHSLIDPHVFYENNLVNTITLLDRMRAHRIPYIIFTSSSAIYGMPQIIPIMEHHAHNPLNPHATIMHTIEMMLKEYEIAYGIKHVALRIFNAAGAIPEYQLWEQHEPETHYIPLLIQAALTGKPFTHYDATHNTPDGSCIRDYVHILDIADAYARALAHLISGNPSDCFNVGSGNGSSVRELICTIEQIYGVTIPIRNTHAHPNDCPMLVANCSRAHDILGWKPRYSSRESIIRSTYISMMHSKRTAAYAAK